MNNYPELLLILERIDETSFSNPERCPRPCGEFTEYVFNGDEVRKYECGHLSKGAVGIANDVLSCNTEIGRRLRIEYNRAQQLSKERAFLRKGQEFQDLVLRFISEYDRMVEKWIEKKNRVSALMRANGHEEDKKYMETNPSLESARAQYLIDKHRTAKQ